MSPFPVLWLGGPSGVGKSTVGWAVHQLVDGTAYVDTDQLGLCFPETGADPSYHRLKARNLGAILPVYRAAGAWALVVSGREESAEVAKQYAAALGDVAMTLCRLRVDHAELRARIERRGWLTHLADTNVREADELDRADFADLCVETGGRTPAEIAREVADRWLAR